MASYKVGRTDFEHNNFGYLSAKLIKEYKVNRTRSNLDENHCHSYFTTFLVRPRCIDNNKRLF